MPEKTPTESEPKTAIQAPAEKNGPRAFNNVLMKLADGDAHEQLSQDLQQLVKTIGVRARESMKPCKGKLALTITITGDHKDVLDVAYDIKLDEPKARRERTVFWADKHGNITEKNPRQVELPMGSLRDVSKKRADVPIDDERADVDPGA